MLNSLPMMNHDDRGTCCSCLYPGTPMCLVFGWEMANEDGKVAYAATHDRRVVVWRDEGAAPDLGREAIACFVCCLRAEGGEQLREGPADSEPVVYEWRCSGMPLVLLLCEHHCGELRTSHRGGENETHGGRAPCRVAPKWVRDFGAGVVTSYAVDSPSETTGTIWIDGQDFPVTSVEWSSYGDDIGPADHSRRDTQDPR